jgi:uncharacterized protein
VDQGDTMTLMKGFLSEQMPKTLETAVLFKKPWSKTQPDYFLEEVSEWVVFPFELGEMGRLRSAMESGLKAEK